MQEAGVDHHPIAFRPAGRINGKYKLQRPIPVTGSPNISLRPVGRINGKYKEGHPKLMFREAEMLARFRPRRPAIRRMDWDSMSN